jgi:hypothetical protein
LQKVGVKWQPILHQDLRQELRKHQSFSEKRSRSKQRWWPRFLASFERKSCKF